METAHQDVFKNEKVPRSDNKKKEFNQRQRSVGRQRHNGDQLYIYSALSNKQMEYVKKFDTAYEIMDELDKRYTKESTALQIICRNRLEKMKLDRYSNTATFKNEFEKAINQLSAAGAKISAQEKLNYMLLNIRF